MATHDPLGAIDQVVRLEDLDHALRQPPRLVAEATVEKWLAATGLAGREVDLETGPPQQANCRYADLRQGLVDDASDE